MIVFPGAKINLGLYVTERRDDGFHNIETLFYPIGFSDILEVVPDRSSASGSIELNVSGISVEGSGDNNLVVKAYRLLHGQTGLPAVKAYLHKCIPTGAGLGGGSSDGSAMLMLLNGLFDLNLSYCDLFGLALRLGSDCPFFLDPVPSFARGRGELLSPAELTLRGFHIMLFHPGPGILTGPAYRHVKTGKPLRPPEWIERSAPGGWRDAVYNVFESYAIEQLPVIKVIKDELYRCGALYASMTGSGSAVYGIFDHEPDIPERISGYFIWKERL